MKFFIPTNIVIESDFQYLTEIFTLIPFLSQNKYDKISYNIKWWEDSLFSKLRICEPCHSICNNIENSDIVILPFKFNYSDNRINILNEECKKYGKKLICFYNDDNFNSFNLDDNIILFRTSVLKSKMLQNERIFPVIIPDYLDFFEEPDNNNIGFAGSCVPNSFRYSILQEFEKNLSSKCCFLRRDGFWHYTNSVNIKGKREFLNNIKNNKYTVCIRGAGNFSYRFYETLSLGRIPILIDTDCKLPFEKIINWDNHIIKINENEIKNLKDVLNDNKINCFNNRILWEKYLSTYGYFKNFIYDI